MSSSFLTSFVAFSAFWHIMKPEGWGKSFQSPLLLPHKSIRRVCRLWKKIVDEFPCPVFLQSSALRKSDEPPLPRKVSGYFPFGACRYGEAANMESLLCNPKSDRLHRLNLISGEVHLIGKLPPDLSLGPFPKQTSPFGFQAGSVVFDLRNGSSHPTSWIDGVFDVSDKNASVIVTHIATQTLVSLPKPKGHTLVSCYAYGNRIALQLAVDLDFSLMVVEFEMTDKKNNKNSKARFVEIFSRAIGGASVHFTSPTPYGLLQPFDDNMRKIFSLLTMTWIDLQKPIDKAGLQCVCGEFLLAYSPSTTRPVIDVFFLPNGRWVREISLDKEAMQLLDTWPLPLAWYFVVADRYLLIGCRVKKVSDGGFTKFKFVK